MNWSYHWRDKNGIEHFTMDRKEAECALHEGYFIQLVPNGRIAG